MSSRISHRVNDYISVLGSRKRVSSKTLKKEKREDDGESLLSVQHMSPKQTQNESSEELKNTLEKEEDQKIIKIGYQMEKLTLPLEDAAEDPQLQKGDEESSQEKSETKKRGNCKGEKEKRMERRKSISLDELKQDRSKDRRKQLQRSKSSSEINLGEMRKECNKVRRTSLQRSKSSSETNKNTNKRSEKRHNKNEEEKDENEVRVERNLKRMKSWKKKQDESTSGDKVSEMESRIKKIEYLHKTNDNLRKEMLLLDQDRAALATLNADVQGILDNYKKMTEAVKKNLMTQPKIEQSFKDTKEKMKDVSNEIKKEQACYEREMKIKEIYAEKVWKIIALLEKKSNDNSLVDEMIFKARFEHKPQSLMLPLDNDKKILVSESNEEHKVTQKKDSKKRDKTKEKQRSKSQDLKQKSKQKKEYSKKNTLQGDKLATKKTGKTEDETTSTAAFMKYMDAIQTKKSCFDDDYDLFLSDDSYTSELDDESFSSAYDDEYYAINPIIARSA